MAIVYKGQQIEIGDSDRTKIYDSKQGIWIPQKINYSNSELVQVFDIELPIMPKQQLIEYKRILSREVDIQDLAEITSRP